MIIRKAELKDLEFIISSNESVNEISNLKESGLARNFEKDILSKEPKAFCVIVEEDKEQIAYCLYSYVYWANEGQCIHISNIFVKPEYRRHGIFKKIMDYIKINEDAYCVTMLVDNENEIMLNALKKYGAKGLNMKTFYLR